MGDNMDLGPFIQNFIDKNPFQELSGLTKPTEHTNLRKTNSSPYSSCNSSTTSSPALFSPSQYLKIAPSGSNNTNSRNKKNDNTVLDLTLSEKNVPSTKAPRVLLPTLAGMLTAPMVTPAADRGVELVKAHVGSNKIFAMHLKDKLVGEKNTALQIWLMRNLKHVPQYPRLYPMRLLLQQVQRYFPNTSSLVLSRVLKFSFPNAKKINNKNGCVFEGLVRRPTIDDLSDLTIRQLARSCHSNVALLSGLPGADLGAGEGTQHRTNPAEQAASVLYWVVAKLGGEEEVLSPRETYDKMMRLHIAETQVELNMHLGEVEDEREETGEYRVKSIWEIEGKTGKKKRTLGSIRLQPLKKKRRSSADDLWDTDDDDNDLDISAKDDEEEWKPSQPITRSSTRSRTRRRASFPPNKSYVDDLTDSVEEGADVVVKTEPTEEDSTQQVEVLNLRKDYEPVEELEVAPLNLATVKDESTEDKDCDDDTKQQPESITTSPGNLIGTLRDAVLQRQFSSRTEFLERELEASQRENQHLEQSLRESKKHAMSLQGQLAERDILISQLAEDFFDVKRRFEQLSNQFKQALTGTLQSNLNNNENS